jgi:hypothetical protein
MAAINSSPTALLITYPDAPALIAAQQALIFIDREFAWV